MPDPIRQAVLAERRAILAELSASIAEWDSTTAHLAEHFRKHPLGRDRPPPIYPTSPPSPAVVAIDWAVHHVARAIARRDRKAKKQPPAARTPRTGTRGPGGTGQE